MRATGPLLFGVLLLLPPAPALAQPPKEGRDRAAVDLLARTKPGAEAKVACEELTVDLGGALIDLGDRTRSDSFERATVAFRLAERAARCAGSEALLGRALNSAGDVLMQRGLLDEALTDAQEAAGIHERLHDTAALAQSWNVIANVRWGHGDMTGALDGQKKSLELREAAGDRSGQAIAFNNIGNVYRVLGRFDDALDYQTRSARIFEELGDRRRAGVVAGNIGLAYFQRGDYASALPFERRALQTHQEIHDLADTGRDLDLLGNTYKTLGAYGDALRAFEAALRVRMDVDIKSGVMETLHNIGLVHFAQGDYQLAIDAYLRGLRLNRTIRDQWFAAEALRNVGAAAWRLGQRERAEADFRESLAIARRSGNRPVEAELLDDLGQMAVARGSLAGGTRLFSEALDLRTAMGDYAGISESLTSLASARLRARQPKAARDLAARAVANATAHDQPELLWHAQTLEGIAERRLHRRDEARRSFLAAIVSIERLSADVVDRESLRQRFFEDKLSPYHEMIALAVDEHSFEDAVEWAERSRTRALAELLSGEHIDEDAILTGDEARERRRLRSAVFTINQQIDDAKTSATRQDLESARRDARSALAAFDVSLAARHPEMAAARGTVKPFVLGDARAIFRDRNTAALEFVVTDTRVFAFLLTKTGSRVTVDGRTIGISAAPLARLAQRFHDEIASRDQAFKPAAAELYSLLVKPFASALAGKTSLVIVPDGALWNVPFQALLGPDGYLIESAAVSYAPSLTVLRETEALPRSTGPATVLAVGQSRFTLPGAGPAFEALPEVEAQLRAIQDIYGPQRSQTLSNEDATEARLKAAAARFSVLHVATHGVLDAASPLYSYLMLTPDPHNDDDGRLEAWEIMRMKLHADLVVLAACDTGRGRIAPGEGVVGMMWALFAAGARAMIVSQFQVEARSATAMLIAFHRELAAGTGSKTEDLRRAGIRLLRTPQFAHPYYWAGFVLMGDPE
jgi:CHAT domain-containing protein/Tfp pilus assembly protein PilF